jgi:hypothetical protein
MSTGPNPFSPGAMPPGGMGGPPPDLASKANTIWWMGILSIPLCCCPLIGIILGAIALVQANSALPLAQQYGATELASKINTGKICAIIGLVLSILNAISGVILNMQGAFNQ